MLELDGVEERLEATLVAVGNGPSFGGGLRITEGAVLDDGMLDVVVIKPLSKLELLRTYPKLFKGTHVHHPQYRHHRDVLGRVQLGRARGEAARQGDHPAVPEGPPGIKVKDVPIPYDSLHQKL